MGDETAKKICIFLLVGLAVYFLFFQPSVNTGGDSNRLQTLPIAFAIGGDAKNSISQGTGAACPNCGAPLP